MQKMSCSSKNCNCHLFHEDVINDVSSKMLSNDEYNDIANLFKVISDINRIKIIEAVSKAPLCVCDIGHLLGVTKSAISHQMKILRKYKIVKGKREGKMIYYSIDNPKILEVIKDARKYLGGE
ncbi:MAG TPA: winged helix-turn-helix transcriptional regulator [Acholeplasmataceae bacterium]|nr:winged helix-turn-helix transcriptional regulator [Acholeplasmataceae bacterium]